MCNVSRGSGRTLPSNADPQSQDVTDDPLAGSRKCVYEDHFGEELKNNPDLEVRRVAGTGASDRSHYLRSRYYNKLLSSINHPANLIMSAEDIRTARRDAKREQAIIEGKEWNSEEEEDEEVAEDQEVEIVFRRPPVDFLVRNDVLYTIPFEFYPFHYSHSQVPPDHVLPREMFRMFLPGDDERETQSEREQTSSIITM